MAESPGSEQSSTARLGEFIALTFSRMMNSCLWEIVFVAEFLWRRRRDLNPRDPFGSNGFQDGRKRVIAARLR